MNGKKNLSLHEIVEQPMGPKNALLNQSLLKFDSSRWLAIINICKRESLEQQPIRLGSSIVDGIRWLMGMSRIEDQWGRDNMRSGVPLI